MREVQIGQSRSLDPHEREVRRGDLACFLSDKQLNVSEYKRLTV